MATARRLRYAWADNPVLANLSNVEGLPASPFELDVSALE
jgi:sialate O-acetylesterase